MLLSPAHGFLFVHVPRTAGSSIVRVLQPLCLPANHSLWSKLIYRMRVPALWQRCHFRHHERQQAIHARLPHAVHSSVFSFAFVRNPYDWLVSLFEYQRQSPAHRKHTRVSSMSFADYVRHEMLRNRRHQWRMLCDAQQRPLVQAIGRHEHLQQDFASICQRLGLVDTALPHVNHSRHRCYQDYYDEPLRQLVAQHWQTDLQLFGYDFNGLGKHARANCMMS